MLASPKPPRTELALGSKPTPLSDDSQTDVGSCPNELNMCLLRAAVLHNVVQSLLNDAKKAQFYVLRYLVRQLLVDKLDLDMVLLSDFIAQAPGRSHKAYVVQFGGMQLVRQSVNVSAKVR